MVIFAVFTVFWLFFTIGTLLVHSVPIVKNSQKTVKTAKKPLVYQSLQVYQDCTNSVPIVKNSQKPQWFMRSASRRQ